MPGSLILYHRRWSRAFAAAFANCTNPPLALIKRGPPLTRLIFCLSLGSSLVILISRNRATIHEYLFSASFLSPPVTKKRERKEKRAKEWTEMKARRAFGILTLLFYSLYILNAPERPFQPSLWWDERETRERDQFDRGLRCRIETWFSLDLIANINVI